MEIYTVNCLTFSAGVLIAVVCCIGDLIVQGFFDAQGKEQRKSRVSHKIE